MWLIRELCQMEHKLRGGNWLLMSYLILKDEVINKIVRRNRGRIANKY